MRSFASLAPFALLVACSSSTPTIPSDGGLDARRADAAPARDSSRPADAGTAIDSARRDATEGADAKEEASHADASPDADSSTPLSCTAVDPLVPFPSGPHGVYVFVNDDTFTYGDAGSGDAGLAATAPPAYMLNAPTLCGADVIVKWSSVDRGPDAGTQYDFTSVDALIAPWKAAGKRVNLLVWGIKDASPTSVNEVTPAWVLASVPSVNCGGTDMPFPELWSSTYIADYEGFVGALLDKYGGDVTIGYMRFGLAGGAEAALGACPGILDAGLTPSIWESYDNTLQSFVKARLAAQGSPVAIVMPTSAYAGGGPDDAGLDPVQQYQVSLTIANGFGVGTESFQTSDEADGGCQANTHYCAVMAQARGHVPIFAQTSVYCTPGNGPCNLALIPDGGGNQGPLPALLSFGDSLGVQIYELYPQDIQVAYDPTFPAYAMYGAEYRAALTKEAARVGAP